MRLFRSLKKMKCLRSFGFVSFRSSTRLNFVNFKNLTVGFNPMHITDSKFIKSLISRAWRGEWSLLLLFV